VLTVLVASLSLAVMGAAPSMADPGDAAEPSSMSECGASQFCVWSGSLYSSAFKGTTSTSPVNLTFTLVQSVWNRSSRAARVYAGVDGAGSSVCYAPGTQLSSVSVSARSIRVLPTSTC